MKIPYLINVTLILSFRFPLNLEQYYSSYKCHFVWWHHYYSITRNKFTDFSRAITIPIKLYQTNTMTKWFTTKCRWQTWGTLPTTTITLLVSFRQVKEGGRSMSLTLLVLWHEEMLGKFSDTMVYANMKIKTLLLW